VVLFLKGATQSVGFSDSRDGISVVIRLRDLVKRNKPGVKVRVVPWDRLLAPPDAFVSHQFADLYPVELNFNNQWQLRRMKFSEEGGHCTVVLHWRCLGPFYGWLRCFAHILNASGRHIASMDHDLLDGRPAAAEWRPGDEGYEARYMTLDASQLHRLRLLVGSSGYEVQDGNSGMGTPLLRLGLFESNTNLRLPLVASSVPLTDDCTAALLSANAAPGVNCRFRLEPGPIAPCRVLFEGDLELWGWSVTEADGAIWVRLGWNVPARSKPPLRFFGHAVPARDTQTETLVSFDQEMALEGQGPVTEFVQDIVRAVPRRENRLAFLRAGVCMSPGLERLRIRESSLECDLEARCFFVSLGNGL
jgi:hypothetical protein